MSLEWLPTASRALQLLRFRWQCNCLVGRGGCGNRLFRVVISTQMRRPIGRPEGRMFRTRKQGMSADGNFRRDPRVAQTTRRDCTGNISASASLQQEDGGSHRRTRQDVQCVREYVILSQRWFETRLGRRVRPGFFFCFLFQYMASYMPCPLTFAT